jgi:hypothetical protein
VVFYASRDQRTSISTICSQDGGGQVTFLQNNYPDALPHFWLET